MRLAIFTDTYLPQVNGVAKTLERLAKYLQQKTIPYVIFAPKVNGYEFGEDNVHTFPSYDFFLYPECKFSLPVYATISEILGHFQPTVLHVTTPFPIGLTGLKYAQEHKIPAVASYHTNFPQYLQYYRLDFLKVIVWHMLRGFHNQFERNYCPSRETMNMLKKQGIKNLEVWSRGISSEQFHPNKRQMHWRARMGGEDKILLLYVGRLAPEKDVEVLLQAIDFVNPSIGHKIHLAIVGDGPLKSELVAKAPENVTFTGYLQGAELASVYASADIFVFPSVTETFGNVILEAMASGLPVIAPNAGGIKDNLRNLENGLVCRSRNHMSMGNKIINLVENNALRNQLAQQAHRYAMGRSWDTIFDELLTSYDDVINTYNNQYKLKIV